MLPLRIVTDSTVDLPSEVTARLGITVIPCLICFGQQSFREDVDITRAEFFERLRAASDFPSTAAPAPGVFGQVYRRLAAETDTIVSIHISAHYSGIYNAARLGAQTMPGNLDIVVVDSGQVSLGMGLMVMAAAEAARDGASLPQVLSLLDDLKPRTHLFAIPDILENLYRSGRINQLVARLGTLLRIKPILHVHQGQVLLDERVRSWGRAQQRLIEIVRGMAPFERVVLAHVQRPEAARLLGEALGDLLPRQTFTFEVGAAISSHVGLGAAGIALVQA